MRYLFFLSFRINFNELEKKKQQIRESARDLISHELEHIVSLVNGYRFVQKKPMFRRECAKCEQDAK